MRHFTITWNKLSNGEFPSEVLIENKLAVSVEPVSIFKDKVTISSTTDEELTPELAFHIGSMVTSTVFTNMI